MSITKLIWKPLPTRSPMMFSNIGSRTHHLKWNLTFIAPLAMINQASFTLALKIISIGLLSPLMNAHAGLSGFFSFLTEFKKLSEDNEQMVILLDESGLNLHASAQADLLKFIEDVLVPKHQVIYTTHSPFMVDANRFERVRTVEDIDNQGVKVSSECLSVDSNTVFPLQAALGYIAWHKHYSLVLIVCLLKIHLTCYICKQCLLFFQAQDVSR
ncbi:conserved hypothetical protein [methanotrophic bacterial endosymbiont of Bathymodiolus sp.]|nr:conserved hypothetical protein [methanotrophic bacterial endosymbiont of Bathymodiolus sp.]